MKNIHFKINNEHIFGTYVSDDELKEILNKIEYDNMLKEFKYKIEENNHIWTIYFNKVIIDGKEFMTI